MFVITQQDDRLLNTQVVEGFGGETIDAVIVFTDEENADRYLQAMSTSSSDSMDASVIAHLSPSSFLKYLTTLASDGIAQLIINPDHDPDSTDAITGYSVIEVDVLLERAAETVIRETRLAAEVPIVQPDHPQYLYHCQECANIVESTEKADFTCCGSPMVLGAKAAS
tara:strand:+ start:184853 stop:185356 length:504 start_codon:yes stop_codon:yes gene_type:complete